MLIKIISFLGLQILTVGLFGQSIQLENLLADKKDCKTIYVVIENRFKITGDIEDLRSVESPTATVSLIADSVTVIPQNIGNVELIFTTKSGQEKVILTAKYLPRLQPIIQENSPADTRFISKEAVIQFGKLKLMTINDDNDISQHYRIDNYMIDYNGKLYSGKGELLTKELLEIISNGKSGDVLIFKTLKIVNTSTGKSADLRHAAVYAFR
jgi:hypothetical protein